MKQKIKVISEEFGNFFEINVQKALDEGYLLKNSYCGLEHFYDGTTTSVYKAILIKELENDSAE